MEQVQQTAHMITEMGIMVTISAVFLVGTAAFFVWMIKSLKNDRDDAKRSNEALIADIKKVMSDLISETRKQNDMLNDVCESIRPELKTRIEKVANQLFKLSIERVYQLMKRVKQENHIIDREGTHEKVMLLVTNLHDERNDTLKEFKYRGKPSSSYSNPEWINWVGNVVEKELYAKEPNDSRTYSNIKNIYEKIRNNFSTRLDNA